jgi:hypothetical protein
MEPKERARQAGRQVRDQKKPKEERKRGPVTLYLDAALFQQFKRECEPLGQSASEIIEDLMRGFLGKAWKGD